MPKYSNIALSSIHLDTCAYSYEAISLQKIFITQALSVPKCTENILLSRSDFTWSGLGSCGSLPGPDTTLVILTSTHSSFCFNPLPLACFALMIILFNWNNLFLLILLVRGNAQQCPFFCVSAAKLRLLLPFDLLLRAASLSCCQK